jgi:hypothetical protein
MLSANLYAKEKRGAKLIITKKNGYQTEGELITVKPNSLLLLDRKSGADVSVDIGDVKVIRIVKKSKVLQGLGIGLLIGGGSGILLGAAESARAEGLEKSSGAVIALLGIVGGLLIGGVVGSSAGKDEAIPIEGKPPAFIEFNLEKLRKKARIRDYK